MTNYNLLQRLANEMMHDFELAKEAATSLEEEEFWEAKIDTLENYLEVLHTSVHTQKITA